MARKTISHLEGQQFGQWTVLEYVGRLGRCNQKHWKCQCSCGIIKVQFEGNITRGLSTRCLSCSSTKHGMKGTPEYLIWAGIIQRTTHSGAFGHIYFDRGIRICDEWRYNFKSFFDHVGPKPSPSHSIDRINNALGYEPGNVRWATPSEQCRNKRANRWIEYKGRRQIITDWEAETGISFHTISDRQKRGVPLDKLFTPTRYSIRKLAKRELVAKANSPLQPPAR